MSLNKFEIEYNTLFPLYTKLEEEAQHIIKYAIKSENIKIHSVPSRIKEKQSYLNKVERLLEERSEPDINDFLGLRIICLFLSDIKSIGDLIRNNFEIISEDNKIDGFNEMTSFGYMSFHFIVKLKQIYVGPRYDDLKDKNFEIQVRTISMDAWANISHYLDYKSEKNIPSELKKDFFALSGLFYIADTHFELFYKSAKESERKSDIDVKKYVDTNVTDVNVNDELNFDTLKSFINTKFKDRDRLNDKATISKLNDDLISADITTISELNKIIDNTADAFKYYERNYHNGKFKNVGVVRISLAIFSEKYRNTRFKANDSTGFGDVQKYVIR